MAIAERVRARKAWTALPIASLHGEASSRLVGSEKADARIASTRWRRSLARRSRWARASSHRGTARIAA
jgi:hypothetical protein